MEDNGWISVNDQMPKPEPGFEGTGWSGSDVLCLTPYTYEIGRTRYGKWVDMENRPIEVTHWQPLPKPPKST